MNNQESASHDKKPQVPSSSSSRLPGMTGGATRLGSLSSIDGGPAARPSQAGAPGIPLSLARPGQPSSASDPAHSASGTADFTHGGVRKTKFVPKVPARRAKKAVQDKEPDESTDDKLTGELKNILNAQQLSQQQHGPGTFGSHLRPAAAPPTRVAFGYGASSSNGFGPGVAAGAGGVSSSGGIRKDGLGGGGGGGIGKGLGRNKSEPFHVDTLDGEFSDVKASRDKKAAPPYEHGRQNAPLVLPHPRTAEPESEQMSEDATGRLLDEEMMIHMAASAAHELRLMPGIDGAAVDERLLFLQLPECMPITSTRDSHGHGEGEGEGEEECGRSAAHEWREGGGGAEGAAMGGEGSSGHGPSGASSASTSSRNASAQKKLAGQGQQQQQQPCVPVPLESVRGYGGGGFVGKLLVHASGAVKMRVGDVLFDVSPGAQCNFHQEVVAIDTNEKSCHFLGSIDQRMIISPDIDHILNLEKHH